LLQTLQLALVELQPFAVNADLKAALALGVQAQHLPSSRSRTELARSVFDPFMDEFASIDGCSKFCGVALRLVIESNMFVGCAGAAQILRRQTYVKL